MKSENYAKRFGLAAVLQNFNRNVFANIFLNKFFKKTNKNESKIIFITHLKKTSFYTYFISFLRNYQ